MNLLVPNRARRLTAIALAAGLLVAACGGDDDAAEAPDTTGAPESTEASDSTDAPESTDTTDATESTDPPATTEPAATTTPTTDAGDDGVRSVPEEYGTIQEAVDASVPGDLVLIAPGVYHEAVDVVTDELTIRGLDRNQVVLDGEFELENGIRILGANGVAVENMTAVNYTVNGFYWIEADGYRGSYLTAQRNGDYGIYAFDSVNGLLEHSYAAGSPDAGYYIGQCYPCNAVIDSVWGEYNGLGYSGTNSGGNLTIVNSQFNNNRAGAVPSSGSYELCYPQRNTTLVGNVAFANGDPDTPTKGLADLAYGTGIAIAGGIGNVVERNLVFDHPRAGIAVAPFPEENPNDDIPTPDEWELDCDEQRQLPLAEVSPADLVAELYLVWNPQNNRVVGNDVSGSGITDLVNSGFGTPTEELGNCFSDNTFGSSQPFDVETLAPCDGEGSGDWSIDAFDPVQIVTFEAPPRIEPIDLDLPPLPQLPGMDDPADAPAAPAVGLPAAVDTGSIALPTGPLFSHES